MRETRIVLYAEDDDDDALLFKLALEECNVPYPVKLVRAENGEVLLNTLHSWLRENYPPPHVIVLDLNMPKINGMRVLRNIRADLHFRGIPVVIFSTSSDQKDIDQAYELGANAYITKQMAPDELFHKISQILELWCDQARVSGWGPKGYI